MGNNTGSKFLKARCVLSFL